MAQDAMDGNSTIPCCPELIKDDHCDVVNFSRVLTYPTSVTATNRRNVLVEVILRFKFTRCTIGLVLGDPVYSTTLLPGEKVKLTSTDRRSSFTYDSETKLSYRSEQISEEQYYMSAVQKYMADSAAAQSGSASSSSDGSWDFSGSAGGSINPFSLSASASTKASGSHNSHSVADYMNQQRSNLQSAASQAVNATRQAHSVSVGEVSSRTHIAGESEDHFESSSREFSNLNKCHAVTYMFYRINKKQTIKFELEAIERRVVDDNAPIAGVLVPGAAKLPISLIPQDVPATALLRKTAADAAGTTFTRVANFQELTIDTALLSQLSASKAGTATTAGAGLENNIPLGTAIRDKALKEVDDQLQGVNLIGKDGKVTDIAKQSILFEAAFSLPTPGIIVKGCLDECDVCEPMLKERMQLENDLLRKQIELLEKSREYRCCGGHDHHEEPGANN